MTQVKRGDEPIAHKTPADTPRGFKRRDLVKTMTLAALAVGASHKASAQAASCPSPGESTYEAVQKRGVLIAGVRYDFSPFGSLNTDGQPEGFGIDLAAEFAKRLGVKVQYVASTAATRIPLLTGGHVDVGVEVPTITVQRQQAIDFTFPYYWDPTVPLFRKDTPFTKIEDMQPPHKVGISRGNSDADHVKALIPNVQIVEYPDLATAVLALKQGIVDATTITAFTGRVRVRENPDLKLGDSFYQDMYGLTLRQNDSRWRNWLEFTLQKLWAEGVFQAMYKKWIGAEPDFTIWSGGPARLQPGIEQWDGKV